MSDEPEPQDPEDRNEAGVRKQIAFIRERGWTPIALVVAPIGAEIARIMLLAVEFDIELIVDPDRDPTDGIGVRYEADTLEPDATLPADPTYRTDPIDLSDDTELEGDEWKRES